jgi:mannose/fructose/N-acetylgalactosamine-specific phosphotransferase system component IIC
MDDLGDGLVKIATDLSKAGAILPVVGFGCLYFMIWLTETAHGLAQDPPLYWLGFGFAVVLGGIGALALLRFVFLQWREGGGT